MRIDVCIHNTVQSEKKVASYFFVYLFYRAGDILRAPSFCCFCIRCVGFCLLLQYRRVYWRNMWYKFVFTIRVWMLAWLYGVENWFSIEKKEEKINNIHLSWEKNSTTISMLIIRDFQVGITTTRTVSSSSLFQLLSNRIPLIFVRRVCHFEWEISFEWFIVWMCSMNEIRWF